MNDPDKKTPIERLAQLINDITFIRQYTDTETKLDFNHPQVTNAFKNAFSSGIGIREISKILNSIGIKTSPASIHRSYHSPKTNQSPYFYDCYQHMENSIKLLAKIGLMSKKNISLLSRGLVGEDIASGEPITGDRLTLLKPKEIANIFYNIIHQYTILLRDTDHFITQEEVSAINCIKSYAAKDDDEDTIHYKLHGILSIAKAVNGLSD